MNNEQWELNKKLKDSPLEITNCKYISDIKSHNFCEAKTFIIFPHKDKIYLNNSVDVVVISKDTFKECGRIDT